MSVQEIFEILLHTKFQKSTNKFQEDFLTNLEEHYKMIEMIFQIKLLKLRPNLMH